MAIWQFTFYISPNIKRNQFKIINEENIDNLWKISNIDYSKFDYFESILNKNKSWNENIVLYGREDSNCIEVIINDSKVSWVSIRIDYRNNCENFINTIIDFALSNSFLLINTDFTIISLDGKNIINFIRHSAQFDKFLKLHNSIN